MTVYNAGNIYLEDLSGGTPDQIHIYAQTDNIADGSVTDAKLASDGVLSKVHDMSAVLPIVMTIEDLICNTGYLINSDNHQYPGGMTVYDNGAYSPLIRVRAGDVVSFKLWCNGANYACVSSYSESEVYLSTLAAGTSGTYTEGTLNFSENALIRFCSRIDTLPMSYVKINGSSDLQDRVSILESYKLDNLVNVVRDYTKFMVAGNLIRADTGALVPYASSLLTDYIGVKAGDSISVRGSANSSNYSILALYDSSKNYLSSPVVGMTNTTVIVSGNHTVSQDGFIRFSTNLNFLDQSYLRINGGSLQERVNDLEMVDSLYTAFQKVGIIGDSYSAVRLYNDGGYPAQFTSGDVPFYSWGKFMERMSGMSYSIFAKGGLECSTWLTDTDNGYPVASQHSNLCQAYIIALGINDISRHDVSYIGTLDDIVDDNPDNNAHSFIGYYAAIIQKMKIVQPYAKFFVVTLPTHPTSDGLSRYEAYNNAIRSISDYFSDTYLIDLYADYHDIYNDSNGFFAKNVVNGHFTPPAYAMVAKIMSREISGIMYDNPSDFTYIEFIGDGYGLD